ncbi:hypothetical protein KO488_15060 [Poseidonibacter lekithochrous]|uniref:hypothetical protein n=1 Tax=Poseidonibacter TaxID=2321187 RepID=UPI001C0A2620|nr:MULTISPECIES: hypothetical protein [Poseidonibacter]MBU3016075.1 hypothetical protein [Poseidonibacter lekithochrous]MDO6829374.1 hypothetical protein [Poseidonibacter sp. 1_MG-2023]
MTLLLICETAIIEQIFSLVCKKLNIDLTITKSNDVNEKYDLIVIDQNFIDDKFNIIKQFSKKLGAISSEELPFDKSRDFIIPRPFLPTKLQEILKEQFSIINEDDISLKNDEYKNTSTYIDSNVYNTHKDEYEEDEEVTVPIITDYVESLAEDVYLDIEEDNDESIVTLASLNNGGILDNSELSKINDILKEEVIHNEIVMNKNDWKDISDIIDDALDEVKEYEFDLNEPTSNENILKLVLSDYNITELKPLLEKFNQDTIDRLSHGESIDIRLVLKDEN